jgi:ATP-dependent Clp protease ATP-binding subunit ClpX
MSDPSQFFKTAATTADSFSFSAPGDDLSGAERGLVAQRLSVLPALSPAEIERQIVDRGYRGQDFARRAGAVLAYRHMARLRRQFLDGIDPDTLPRRENYLFLGATGSGKTYLVELIFRDILRVPTVVADMTRFTEAGYVGDDVQMLLSQLFEAAGQDRGWASCGAVCLDEFDKLAASRSNARFAGEGTTKDVSGFGVQRGLLTLLSGKNSPFPTDFGFSGHGARKVMPLQNVTFIAAGAFSGLKETAELSHSGHGIGFGAKPRPANDHALASKIGAELLDNTRAFSDYGILPELVGRFSRLVPFQPLGPEVLREILEDTLISSYRNEFAHEGVELTIAEAVIDHVIEAASRRETGARGLRAALVPHLEEAAFHTFGQRLPARVTLDLKDGEIRAETEMEI